MSSCQHHPLLLNSRDVSRCAHQLLLQARKNSRADTLRQYRFTQPLPPPPRHSITSGHLHFCVIPPLVRAWGHRPHPSPALMSFDGVMRMLQCWVFFFVLLSHFSQPCRIPSGLLPFKPVICFSSCKALTPFPHRDERPRESGSNSTRIRVHISLGCALKAQRDARRYGLANKIYKALQTGNYPSLT